MLGAIIGDTIGSAYEFHNTKEYDFTLFLGNSAYTDDSIMTMAVAYWLLKDKEHTYQGLEDIMVEFGGGFYCWLFHPGELYAYDDRYGDAPYESQTGRHPYGSWGVVLLLVNSLSWQKVLASLLVVGGVVLVSTYFSRFQRFSIPRCSQ